MLKLYNSISLLFTKNKISKINNLDNDVPVNHRRLNNYILDNNNIEELEKQYKTVSEYNYILHLNKLGNIIFISNELLILLEYTFDEINNKFIGKLTNDSMSLYLKKIFSLNNKSYIEINLLLNNNITIYNKHNHNIIFIIDNIKINNIFEFKLISNLYINNKINNYLYLYIYKDFIPTNKFIESNNIVIISIDIIESTLLLVDNIEKYLCLYKKLHKNIIFLLKYKYYPYIYIHEILGDSYIFISNLEIINNISICASLCYNFIKDLNNLIKENINIRIGMIYGKIYYGLIDNAIRFFGENINKVNRLQSNCIKNNILVCSNFYEQIKYEINIFENDYIFKETSIYLKGLGYNKCYFIEI
jgi:hypothetical protein